MRRTRKNKDPMRNEAVLWPEVLEDEGAVQAFLPRYGRLRNYLEDHPLPEGARDPMGSGARPTGAWLGAGYNVVSNNQRDYRGGTLTEGQWSALRDAFGNKCAYCRTSNGAHVIEHVVPLAAGGRTSIDNVVPSCSRCNLSKNQKSLDRWRGEEWADRFRERWVIALMKAKEKAR